MFAQFNEQHDISLTYCTPNIGSFALKTDSGRISHWDNCREQFAAKFVEDMEGFYFSHRENKGCDIANFIHHFEIILKSLLSLSSSINFGFNPARTSAPPSLNNL